MLLPQKKCETRCGDAGLTNLAIGMFKRIRPFQLTPLPGSQIFKIGHKGVRDFIFLSSDNALLRPCFTLVACSMSFYLLVHV